MSLTELSNVFEFSVWLVYDICVGQQRNYEEIMMCGRKESRNNNSLGV